MKSTTISILIALTLAVTACEDESDGSGVGAGGVGAGGSGSNSTVWTDPATDLTWPNVHLEPMSWQDANTYCNDLDFGGHDDWRLPTISELRTLVRGCTTQSSDGACGVTDTCVTSDCQDTCYPCVSGHGPTNGCYGPAELPDECGCFWSSTFYASATDLWWDFDFEDGFIDTNDYNVNLVRCVRP